MDVPISGRENSINRCNDEIVLIITSGINPISQFSFHEGPFINPVIE